MNDSNGEAGVNGFRVLATRVAGRVGGLAAVRTLRATLSVYDAAGGGLVAGGLAYSSLIALLPGLLLVLSIVGILVADPADRERFVVIIAVAVPPLEDIARTAFEQVASGAVPTGILAAIGLLWGSSRFYASLDNALSRVFHDAPRRNAVQRTIRGIVVTALFVALPMVALVTGSVASWLLDLAPVGMEITGAARGLWRAASPLGSFALFVGGTAAVYRWVPAVRVPFRSLLPPALVVGFVLAAFTQLFTFAAPRLVGVAALYGTFAAIFGLLAWLAIGFNVLLLGAAWASVRASGRHTGGPGSVQGSGDVLERPGKADEVAD
jgi:membrane protein